MISILLLRLLLLQSLMMWLLLIAFVEHWCVITSWAMRNTNIMVADRGTGVIYRDIPMIVIRRDPLMIILRMHSSATISSKIKVMTSCWSVRIHGGNPLKISQIIGWRSIHALLHIRSWSITLTSVSSWIWRERNGGTWSDFFKIIVLGRLIVVIPPIIEWRLMAESLYPVLWLPAAQELSLTWLKRVLSRYGKTQALQSIIPAMSKRICGLRLVYLGVALGPFSWLWTRSRTIIMSLIVLCSRL